MDWLVISAIVIGVGGLALVAVLEFIDFSANLDGDKEE